VQQIPVGTAVIVQINQSHEGKRFRLVGTPNRSINWIIDGDGFEVILIKNSGFRPVRPQDAGG
jgi:hypothetical protein